MCVCVCVLDSGMLCVMDVCMLVCTVWVGDRSVSVLGVEIVVCNVEVGKCLKLILIRSNVCLKEKLL